jgi:hypothetical protein
MKESDQSPLDFHEFRILFKKSLEDMLKANDAFLKLMDRVPQEKELDILKSEVIQYQSRIKGVLAEVEDDIKNSYS